MAHGLAFGGGEARDVGDDRLGHVLGDPRCGAFFSVATDLTNHDNQIGIGVVFESFQSIDVGGSHNRVTANTNAGGEAQVA